MKIAVILAGGKGTRFKANGSNKTSSVINGIPIVRMGVETVMQCVDTTYVVVGAYGESVQKALEGLDVSYIEQKEQLGTGHAIQVALSEIHSSPTHILVGYGDHLMCYTPDIVRTMFTAHDAAHAAITMVTVELDNPNLYRWGRIVRNGGGTVKKIVEQKDANEQELQIRESNAGLYVFDAPFLRHHIGELEKSPVTGEYYITDFIEIAVRNNLTVLPYPVEYSYVGPGVNTSEQLEETEKIINRRHGTR